MTTNTIMLNELPDDLRACFDVVGKALEAHDQDMVAHVLGASMGIDYHSWANAKDRDDRYPVNSFIHLRNVQLALVAGFTAGKVAVDVAIGQLQQEGVSGAAGAVVIDEAANITPEQVDKVTSHDA